MESPRLLYRVALAWNLFLGLPLGLAPAFALGLEGYALPPGGLAEYLARSMGMAIALFGLVYFEMGRDPIRHRRFVAIAIGAKLMAFVFATFAVIRDPSLLRLCLPVVGDLVFAVLFARDARFLGR